MDPDRLEFQRRRMCPMIRRPSLASPLGLAILLLSSSAASVKADAISEIPRHKIDSSTRPDRSSAMAQRSQGVSSGWWIGSVTLALMLGGLGVAGLAARRFLPSGDPAGTLQVVGRTSLSSKQAVYLLRVGERVLIVGSGAQGAPSLLGELDDPLEISRLTTPRTSSIARPQVSAARLFSSLSRRPGGVS